VAVNGDALGQGLELVLAGDIRVASENATFGFPDTAFGLIPQDGGTQRLPPLVGKTKALEMLFTAEPIDVQEARRIGLVNKVVSQEELMPTVMGLATTMTSKGPIALRYAKEAVHKGLDLTLAQGLRLEADLYLLLQTTRDRTEGIRAFLEKRTPQFKGE
jgi:enoyl-CoA hydratase/carnithine racemase